MPIVDGYETTQRLRAQELTHNYAASIPIIALTAHNANSEREKCLAVGMNDYLSKPFNRHSFNKILTTWLKPTICVLPPADNIEILNSSEKSASNLPVIWNETAALAQLDGDKELLDDMVQLFLEQTPELLTQLQRDLDCENFAALADTAHALKNVVSHFCAKALVLEITTLEITARENKIANFEIMTKNVIHTTSQLIDILTHRK